MAKYVRCVVLLLLQFICSYSRIDDLTNSLAYEVNPWFDFSQGAEDGLDKSSYLTSKGLVTFNVVLSADVGSNRQDNNVVGNKIMDEKYDQFGLELYSRLEDYHLPSIGDVLETSTAVFPAVLSVLSLSPAFKSGILPGDLILSINNHRNARVHPAEIKKYIKSQVEINLLIWRRSPYYNPITTSLKARHEQQQLLSDNERTYRDLEFNENILEENRLKFVLSVVAYNRPNYFKQVLEAISECYGIEKYTIFLFIEPSEVKDELYLIADSFREEMCSQCNVIILKNPILFGFPHNIRQALEVGFTQSDFVILIEDDIILSPDALVW